MADRTHGGNHAPLLNGGWLKPGFCAGCDDSEEYARIFNEGYEAAMAQHLADDPSAADDWLAAHTAAAKREGARAVVEAVWKARAAFQCVTKAGDDDFITRAYTDALRAAREAAARFGGGA